MFTIKISKMFQVGISYEKKKKVQKNMEEQSTRE